MNAWRNFENWLRQSAVVRKLLDWSFGQNQYLWVHALAGLVVGLLAVLLSIPTRSVLALVFFGSMLWECFEFFVDDIVFTYGSTERFLYDGLGDTVAATVCCWFVVMAADVAAARVIGTIN